MRLRQPSAATVISCVALFVALGGTGYAVTALPRDSVGSRQLRARAVKESELGSRAVITSKLADQAVTREKLAPGAVTADRVASDALGGGQIDESSLGPVPFATDATHAATAGRATLADRVELADRATRAANADAADRAALADDARHADLADHAASADALSRVDRNEESYEIADASLGSIIVECDAGLVPVGGGFTRAASNSDWPWLYGSAPVDGGWRLDILDYNVTVGLPVRGTAYAICVQADGT